MVKVYSLSLTLCRCVATLREAFFGASLNGAHFFIFWRNVKMKRLITLLMALLMVFAIVGCDGTYEDTSYNTNTSIKETKKEDIKDETVTNPKEENKVEKDETKTEKEDNKKTETQKENTQTIIPETPKAPTVTVPKQEETVGNLVWVPTHGGKKYHRKSSCSNMKNPMQVTKETAEANGFGPCGRCY